MKAKDNMVRMITDGKMTFHSVAAIIMFITDSTIPYVGLVKFEMNTETNTIESLSLHHQVLDLLVVSLCQRESQCTSKS